MTYTSRLPGFHLVAAWTDNGGHRRVQISFRDATHRIVALNSATDLPSPDDARAFARWMGHCAGRRYTVQDALGLLAALAPNEPTPPPRAA